MQIAKRDLLLTGKKIYLIGREIVSLFLFLCYCNVCFNYLVKKGIIGNYQLSSIKFNMYMHSDTKELSIVHHNKETLCFVFYYHKIVLLSLHFNEGIGGKCKHFNSLIDSI